MSNLFTRRLWDYLGMGISGLCAVHCLFFPVSIALLPLFPVAESLHDWTHPVLFGLIVPTVVFALRGRSVTDSIGLYLMSGLLTVGLAWMMHEWLGNWGEAGLTLAGSLLLIRGHWINFVEHKIRYAEKYYEKA